MSIFVHGWPKTTATAEGNTISTARIVLVVMLLALVVGLGYLHINGTYKPWLNCNYLFVNTMKMDQWVCMEKVENGDYAPQWVKDFANSPRALCTNLQGADIFGGKPLSWLPCPGKMTWPSIAGPLRAVNPPLEWLRGVAVWTILAFFLIVSLVLTIIANIVLPPIIRILTFNREEWYKLLGTLRTWFLILAVFLLLFLFSLYRTGGWGLAQAQ